VLIEKIFGRKQKGKSDGTDNKSSFFTVLIENIFGKRQKQKSLETESTNPSEVK